MGGSRWLHLGEVTPGKLSRWWGRDLCKFLPAWSGGMSRATVGEKSSVRYLGGYEDYNQNLCLMKGSRVNSSFGPTKCKREQ